MGGESNGGIGAKGLMGVEVFMAQGVCVGIGLGLMWLPSVTLIATYFAKKRILAVTAAATGTSTGGMIFPAMIQHLTPKIGILHFVPWEVRRG